MISVASKLDRETCNGEVKKARGKQNPLTIPALEPLREESARTLAPPPLPPGQAQKRQPPSRDLASAAYGLTLAEVELMERFLTANVDQLLPTSQSSMREAESLKVSSSRCTQSSPQRVGRNRGLRQGQVGTV